jgi:hypothetical protein
LHQNNPGGNNSVPINSPETGVALRAGIRTVRRSLLLLFASALLALCAGTAKAESSENGTAPALVPAEGSGRAVVFNEDPSNAQGREYPGSVTWRTDLVKAAGQPDEIVVHADVEIPDLNMKMKLDFKQNTDKSLPASHTMELTFLIPKDVAGGDVIALPGLLMKFSDRGRGVPLVSQIVKVAKGLFLVGLSNVAADRTRNLQHLKERQWIDVPMVYADQHRGILAIEKGYDGETIFHDAMEAWERPR